MQFLKQSTSATVVLGVFVDDTDGKTAETGLTISQADIRLSKNGAAFAQTNNAAGATHMENGYYSVPLDTTDTATLGRLTVAVSESGALPVYREYMVLTANVFDTLCSTDTLQADLTQIGGVAQSATDLKDFADAGYDPATNKVQGVVLVDTTTTNTDMVSEPPTAAANADAVWDEAAAGHVGAGTFGAQAGTDIDAILVDTAEIGAAGAGLTAVPWNANWDAEVESEVDDALGGGTGTALTAIPWNSAWDAEVQSEVDDALVANNLDHLAKTATAAADMTTEVADNTILSRILSNGDTSAFVPSTDGLQPIRDTAPLGTAMRGTDSAALASVATEARLAELDAANLPADVDAILADTDDIGVAGAGLTAIPWNAAWDAEAQSEATDALNAYDPPTKAELDTGFAALNDVAVTDITQRQIPDSVPADGTLPTIEQALYMITQYLYERAVSNTTVTIKKVDGSTSLLTLTLDDATDPTSITRAT